jgi:hypothetical protein
MSSGIDLTKKARIVLEKKGLRTFKPLRIGFALDISGSMQDEYQNGLVQTTFDRMLSIASNLDSNGEMDVWTFHTKPSVAPTATKGDFGTYIQKQILSNSNISKWGGTAFEPVLKLAVDNYFGTVVTTTTTEKKVGGLFGFGAKTVTETTEERTDAVDVNIPAMVMLITDGESGSYDNSLVDDLFDKSRDKKIYFNLIAVSNQANFGFLEKMADKYDNVGFVHIKNLKATDEEILDVVITQEVVTFLNIA